MSDDTKQGETRRRFFAKAGATVAATAGVVALGGNEASAEPTIEQLRAAIKAEYRPLGKTGKMVSKVGVGTASLTTPSVLARALDYGLNYVDTAHCYMGGKSETTVGKILKTRRKDVVLTTKWHPGAKAKRKEMLDSLDESLQRLQCDHVDCILVHDVGDVARIQNPEVFEAFEIARKAGKVSHLGMSTHSPNLMEVVREAIKLKRYEVVLLKYNFMSYPQLDPLLEELQQANIGVTVMKTLSGARHAELGKFEKGDGFPASALRWASSNPRVASAVISAETFDDVELYAKVAGQKLAARDVEVLRQYASTFDSVQCRWCGECAEACPSGVKVWEVDRAAMYYERYGNERRGMELYAELGQPAAACAGCAAPCEGSCRFRIPIREQMTHAHDLLEWARS